MLKEWKNYPQSWGRETYFRIIENTVSVWIDKISVF